MPFEWPGNGSDQKGRTHLSCVDLMSRVKSGAGWGWGVGAGRGEVMGVGGVRGDGAGQREMERGGATISAAPLRRPNEYVRMGWWGWDDRVGKG